MAKKRVGSKMFVVMVEHNPPSPKTMPTRIIVTCPENEQDDTALENARQYFKRQNYIPEYLAKKSIACKIVAKMDSDLDFDKIEQIIGKKFLSKNPTKEQIDLFIHVLKRCHDWQRKYLGQKPTH